MFTTFMSRTAVIFGCLLIGSCAFRFYEAAPVPDIASSVDPWLVHCETVRSRAPDPDSMLGTKSRRWLVANSSDGMPLTLTGHLQDGFFVMESGDNVVDMRELRSACLVTMASNGGDKWNELAAVRATRKSDGVNISIDFGADTEQSPIQKLVVFSDSLSDSGKLKERIYVLPGSPYWAGRFSNGPNWIDYLEAWSALPVQNHSFGGASVTGPENISRQNLYSLIHDKGQYFVSGSIDHQIDDFEKGFLAGKPLTGTEDTAFIVWTGSNDYISKEPFSGTIDTLLNHPLQEGGYRAVVDLVIAATYRQLERIYALGARYILVANLPNLGDTPIVLQNNTYSSTRRDASDGLRRLTLAARLEELSQYHNEQLAITVARFRANKADLNLVEFDADGVFSALLQNSVSVPIVDEEIYPEFAIRAQGSLVQEGNRSKFFQQRCYQGGYFGSSQPSNICNQADRVVFWDVIHPTTYAHCWSAYFFGLKMHRAGWISEPPPIAQYKNWCQKKSEMMLGHERIEDVLSGM